MSEQTKAALEQALQDHLNDECGPNRVLTDYVLTYEPVTIAAG